MRRRSYVCTPVANRVSFRARSGPERVSRQYPQVYSARANAPSVIHGDPPSSSS